MGPLRIPWPIVAALFHLCIFSSATYYEASMPYKQEILNATEVTCGSTVTVQPGQKYLFDSRSAIIYESLAAQRNDSYYYRRRKRETVLAKILPEARSYGHGAQGHKPNYGHGGGSYGGGGGGSYGGGGGGYKAEYHSGGSGGGGYHSSGDSHVLPSCTWTYIASPNCSLEAYIVRFKAGDLNCYKQQLVISDNKTEFRMCGNAKLYPAFRSETGNLTIKFSRESYTYRHVFKGYVTCNGRGVTKPTNQSVSIMETIRTVGLNGNQETVQVLVKETKTQELLSNPMMDNGKKQFMTVNEEKISDDQKFKSLFGNQFVNIEQQKMSGVKETQHVVEQQQPQFFNNADQQQQFNFNEMDTNEEIIQEQNDRIQQNAEELNVGSFSENDHSFSQHNFDVLKAESPQRQEVIVNVADDSVKEEAFNKQPNLFEEESNSEHSDVFAEQVNTGQIQEVVVAAEEEKEHHSKVVVDNASPSVAFVQHPQQQINREIRNEAILVEEANVEQENPQVSEDTSLLDLKLNLGNEKTEQFSNFNGQSQDLETLKEVVVESDQNEEILQDNKFLDEENNFDSQVDELDSEVLISSPKETLQSAHHQSSVAVESASRIHPQHSHVEAVHEGSSHHTQSAEELEMTKLLAQAGILEAASAPHSMMDAKLAIASNKVNHAHSADKNFEAQSIVINQPQTGHSSHVSQEIIMANNPQQVQVIQADLINEQSRTMPSYTYPANSAPAPLYIKYPTTINQYNPSIYSARNPFPDTETSVIGRSREELEEEYLSQHPPNYSRTEPQLVMAPIPYRQSVSTYPYIQPASSGQYTYLVAAPTNPNMKYIVNCQLPPPYPCTPPQAVTPTYASYSPQSVVYGR